MGYVYSNPYADAANAMTGGMNTIGDTVLKMAMLKQSGLQRQQDMMMQIAQLQQGNAYNQQRLGMDQQRIDLERSGQVDSSKFRDKEFGLRSREADARIGQETANTAEVKQKGAQEKQRFDQAMAYETMKQRLGELASHIGRFNSVAQQGPVMPGQPPLPGVQQPELNDQGQGELQSLMMRLSPNPDKGLESVAMMQALQAGALNNPLAQTALVTGSKLGHTPAPLFGANSLSALGLMAENMPPGSPLQLAATSKLLELLGGGQALSGTNAPPTQRKVGDVVKTAKGTFKWNGQSWDPAQ